MKISNKILKELLFELLIIAGETSAICLFWASNLLCSIVLAAVLIIALIFWHKREDLYYCATGAVLGPIIGSICIYYGAWAYTEPASLLANIPVWLPLAWGLAALGIRNIAETIIKIKK